MDENLPKSCVIQKKIVTLRTHYINQLNDSIFDKWFNHRCVVLFACHWVRFGIQYDPDISHSSGCVIRGGSICVLCVCCETRSSAGVGAVTFRNIPITRVG